MKRDPDLPETEGFEHLIEYLFRVGPVVQGGFGAVNLSFTEIDAWARRVKIPLTGWESETLHMMSKSYTYQHSISSKRDCPQPWISKAAVKTEKQQDDLGDEILKKFESLAASKNKKPTRKPRATPAPKRGPKPTI